VNNPMEGVYFVGALIAGSALHHFSAKNAA